jgi:hypothetical protein
MARKGVSRPGRRHLPPGHQPGAQSRRAERGAPLGYGFLTLVTLGLLAGAIVLFAGAAQDKSPSGARVGGVIFLVGAIAFALLLAWLVRRRHPNEARHLELTVEPIEARLGDTVTATVAVTDAEKLGEALELGLTCTEYYDVKQEVYTQNGSSEQRVLRTTDAYATWSELDRATLQQSVRFKVPANAPFSYEGGAVSWAWHVVLRDRRAHHPDRLRDVPIWVSP